MADTIGAMAHIASISNSIAATNLFTNAVLNFSYFISRREDQTKNLWVNAIGCMLPFADDQKTIYEIPINDIRRRDVVPKNIAILVFVALIFLFSSIPIHAAPAEHYANSISDNAANMAVEKTLTNYGVQIYKVNTFDGRANGGDKSMLIGYVSTEQSTDGVALEIDKILGAWLGVVKLGWDCDSMIAGIGGTNGMAIGTWYCSKEWKDAYLNGDLTQVQLVIKVIGTVTQM